jgi:hypothetical protein
MIQAYGLEGDGIFGFLLHVAHLERHHAKLIPSQTPSILHPIFQREDSIKIAFPMLYRIFAAAHLLRSNPPALGIWRALYPPFKSFPTLIDPKP